ncbi:CoA pyrophosphatase [Flagellimonas sp. HMM57]|uniref:NUDIX hydrolase n=1 Tax=unclassified Flagellimonas TaxID=2644544 RepID=UPI0013D6990E|nr:MULTISPECIES: CoA pyrophosphatase [unclassified Flagellimonas]MBS9463730.1 CoA pyrophosphatase [Flagellimonas sp. 389]UII76355.1 CoA pyrophosphatase [Flagellimonas sp. HMM57]
MNFEEFYQQALKIKNLPLPGTDSHHKMSPAMRIKWLESREIEKMKPRKAGVMALFYPDLYQKTKLLLILRKTYEGVHSNQIGFPGGKVEKEDKNLLDTALRETHEEVGVPPESVEVLKQLSEVYIPPSNFLVQPFIGMYSNPKPFLIQESEVEDVVEVYLHDFLDNANLMEQKLSTSYAKNINVPAYKLNGYTVWGATAMMMSEIKELLEQVL